MLLTELSQVIPGISYKLNILKRQSTPYTLLLYQHEGNFFYDDTRIGNTSIDDKVFESLLNVVIDKHPDLFMTPEYSFPLKYILKILQNKAWQPDQERLWAIAGESISQIELKHLNDFNSDEILIYHEKIENPNGSFFDPLYYIFRGIHDGKDKLIVVVQFKTQHMGVWTQDANIERDNIIQGTQVYILSNADDTIYLVTLICSEAIQFRNSLTKMQKDIDWQDKPFLILNPQFNSKPNHPDFISFRKTVFEKRHKEIISLNWNSGSFIKGGNFTEHNVSRSGFYIESEGIEFNNFDRIRNNHQKGIYYFNNKKSRHTFLLNGRVSGYFIKNISVGLTDQSALNRRDGPLVKEVYLKGKSGLILTESPVEDFHINFLQSLNCENEFLLNQDNCVGDKEILVCLSSGEANTSDAKWYKFNLLSNVQMNEDDEVNIRVTIGEDSETNSVKQRSHFIDAINELDVVVGNSKELPESLADLRQKKLKIAYYKDAEKDGYRYNVVTEEGQRQPATLIYIGPANFATADKTYKKMQKLFDFNNKQRVVVYYKLGKKIEARFAEDPANIMDISSTDDSNLITKTGA